MIAATAGASEAATSALRQPLESYRRHLEQEDSPFITVEVKPRRALARSEQL